MDIEILSSIGSSAFGEVFMGKHDGHHELVAVKRMPKERGQQSRARTIEKIQQEAHCLGMMGSHPGVARLISTYEDSDFVHIATQLVPGGDLQKYSESVGPLDEESLSLVALEIIRVISDCHHLGIVHGDIKPGNVCIVDPSKQLLFPYIEQGLDSAYSSFRKRELSVGQLKHCLKLIDFGSSQILGNPPSKRSSRRTGTPAFMSPQVFARDYGQETDIWSLGVTLYWLKSHSLPFQGDLKNGLTKIEDLEAAVIHQDISLELEPFRGMSQIGIDFVAKCLCRSESDRMTANSALSHPWLVAAANSQERLISAFLNQPVGNVLDLAGLKSLQLTSATVRL